MATGADPREQNRRPGHSLIGAEHRPARCAPHATLTDAKVYQDVATSHRRLTTSTYAPQRASLTTWLVGLLPDTTVKTYADAGHGFLFQHHDEFAADVTAFLDADRETV